MIRLNRNLILFGSFILVWGIFSLIYLNKSLPLISHTIYYCESVINSFSTPIPYVLNFAPIAIFSILVSTVVIKLIVSVFKAHKLRKSLIQNTCNDKRFSRLLNNLHLAGKARLVSDRKYFVFCLGIRQPKIYVSTGAFKTLTHKELEAVLRHEQYHLENHDTIIMTLASISQSLLPFFPLLTDLITKYKIDREIRADKFAVQSLGSSASLISALKKFLLPSSNFSVLIASIADTDTIEPRIHALANTPYTTKRVNFIHLAVSLFSLFFVVTLLAVPVHALEIHHEEYDVLVICTDTGCMNACATEKNLTKLYSEIPTSSTKMIHPPMSQSLTPAF